MYTIHEVLDILKEIYNLELDHDYKKSLDRVRDWVRRGIIAGPIERLGVGVTGGRKGIYDEELPIQLAVIIYLKNILKLQLDEIGEARRRYDELRGKSCFITGHQTFKLPEHKLFYIKNWIYYFEKTKVGYDFDTPAFVFVFWDELKDKVLAKVKEDDIGRVEFKFQFLPKPDNHFLKAIKEADMEGRDKDKN